VLPETQVLNGKVWAETLAIKPIRAIAKKICLLRLSINLGFSKMKNIVLKLLVFGFT
jgi:hypothetical protein